MPISKEMAERRNSNVQVDFTKEAQREFEKLSPKEKDIRILEDEASTLKIQISELETKIAIAQKYNYNENSYKNKEVKLAELRLQLKAINREKEKLQQGQNHSSQEKENFQRLVKKAQSQAQTNEHGETNKENRVLTKQVSQSSIRSEIGNEIKELSEKIAGCKADLKQAGFAHRGYTLKLHSAKKLLNDAEIKQQKVTKKKEAIEKQNWFKKCFRFMFRGDKSKLKKYNESLVKLETNITGLKEKVSNLQQEVKTHEVKKTNLKTELKELKDADKIAQQEFRNIGKQKAMDSKSKSPTRTSTGER